MPRRGSRLWRSATRSRTTPSARLLAFHRLLVEDPLAPTAVRDPLKAIDDHLADSLVGLELEPIRSAVDLADLGSGAGVPGLALAIALPGDEGFSRRERARGGARSSSGPSPPLRPRTPSS